MTRPAALETWHHLVRNRDASGLPALVAEDAVFHSPVVHAPQQGRARVCAYLGAAFAVLGNDSFRYVRELVEGNQAALEFQVDIEGIVVNGIDLIAWDEAGRKVDFKVMIRPLKAIELIHGLMARQLARGA